VGLSVDGRTREEWRGTVGPLTNVLPLRNRPANDKTVAQFLAEVDENVRLAHENQDYPLEQLVVKLGWEGEPNRHPLLDAAFQMHQINGSESWNNRVPVVKEYRLKQKKVTYDLNLEAVAHEDTLVMTMEYAAALYKKTTVEKMTERYLDILKQAAADTEIKLKDILISHRLLRVESKNLQDDGGDFGF
jgi:non-ribosomal peptide synthetase component F